MMEVAWLERVAAWAIPGAMAAWALWRRRTGLEETGWTAALSAVWIGAALLTEDRRLYFPFMMQLAVQLSCLAWPLGMAMVGIFTAVRLLQGATPGVLLVELVVAAAALGVGLWVNRRGPEKGSIRVSAGAAGALVALCGLAI